MRARCEREGMSGCGRGRIVYARVYVRACVVRVVIVVMVFGAWAEGDCVVSRSSRGRERVMGECAGASAAAVRKCRLWCLFGDSQSRCSEGDESEECPRPRTKRALRRGSVRESWSESTPWARRRRGGRAEGEGEDEGDEDDAEEALRLQT